MAIFSRPTLLVWADNNGTQEIGFKHSGENEAETDGEGLSFRAIMLFRCSIMDTAEKLRSA